MIISLTGMKNKVKAQHWRCFWGKAARCKKISAPRRTFGEAHRGNIIVPRRACLITPRRAVSVSLFLFLFAVVVPRPVWALPPTATAQSESNAVREHAPSAQSATVNSTGGNVQNTQDVTQKAIDTFIDSLSGSERVAQLLAIGIEGTTEMPLYAKTEFASAPPGSFLLFKANIGNKPLDVIDFTQSVHDWYTAQNNFVPPLNLIDNEGGDVYRINAIASPLPSAADMVRFFTVQEAETYYELIGKQMNALSLQVNLAPLVEPLFDENRAFLQNRSYGKPIVASSYSAGALRGYQKAGIASVIKHFPGNTSADPHEKLSVLEVSKTDFDQKYKSAFARLIQTQPVSALLMSHACVPCIEEGVPACLSREMVQGVVRGELGFDGVVISDDVFMGALGKSGFTGEEAAIRAVYAGVDILMMSEKHYGGIFDSLMSEYEKSGAFRDLVTQSVKRILRLKLSVGLMAVKVDGEGATLTSVPFKARDERLTAFENAKNEADAFYAEVMAKWR